MANLSGYYIADKQRYITEARRSAKSLRACMPDVDTILFTPLKEIVNRGYEEFTHVIVLPEREHEFWFLDHTRYMGIALDKLWHIGYNKTIFLDTDTYIVEPVYELYEMLRTFDFMGAHAPARFTRRIDNDVPSAFPEINIGVNPMRASGVKYLWENAYTVFNENPTRYGNNDQGVLREILFKRIMCNRLRFHTLSPEYNCRFNFPCFVCREVKILHGHSDNIEEIAKKINKSEEMRVWNSVQEF